MRTMQAKTHARFLGNEFVFMASRYSFLAEQLKVKIARLQADATFKEERELLASTAESQ